LPPGPLVVWRGAAVEEIDTGFAAACKRADLPGGENTYSIRHAAARYMLQKGVPRAEIGQWLGHIKPDESSETTLIYSPYAPDYLVDAKAAIEDFVREIASHCRKRDLLMPPWRK
jgi:integrase